MPFCVHCGHRLEEGASFCGNCGARISAAGASNGPIHKYQDAPIVVEAQVTSSPDDVRLKRYENEDLEFKEKYAKWETQLDYWKKFELYALGAFGVFFIVSAIMAGTRIFRSLGYFIKDNIMMIPFGFAYFGLIFWGGYLYLSNPKRQYKKLIAKREQFEIERLEALAKQNNKQKKKSFFNW